MKTFMRSAAVSAAAALALTACGGGGGAGGGDASSVASAFDARFSDGAAFTLSLDGDVDALADASGEEIPPSLLDGTINGAIGPDGNFAFGVNDAGVQVKYIDEALYLQVDLETLAGTMPELDPAQLQGLAAGAPPELAGVIEAALAGDWIGVTGLTPEAIQDAAGQFGATAPEDQDVEGLRDALEQQGLTDGQTLVDEYLVIEGEGPTYDVTLKARELATALNEVAAEVEEAAAGAGVSAEEMDPEEVPEEIGGVQITIEGDTLTEIRLDLATFGETIEGDTMGLSEGDVALVVSLSDIGDELNAPSDATTVTFDALLGGAMGLLMGGGGLSG